MSIITLFNPLNPVSALNAQSASYYSESEKNISENFKHIKEFEPPLDFTTASNWCHYGSLELYYEYGFKKVYQTYPYDGSAYEKNLYRNNSSQVDNYIFDKLYPKSTGYAQFFAGRFASAITSISNGGFKYYISNKPEYITTFGGPNTASAGMENKPLSETFDDSNKYDVALRRESNLEFDFSYGNTIEFWMNKRQFPTADGREVIFDLSNGNEIRNPGRLTIELDPTNTTSPFEVTIESGSTAHTFTLGSDITTADLITAGWHHYAFAFVSSSVSGEETRVNFFYDGNLVETQYAPYGFSRVSGALKSRIGALVAPTTQVPAVLEEYGQFSGSLDEFRYWKYDRPADLVKLNYFKGVDGGTNTDDESYQLGVYYKFNEGITQTDSVDSIVLDYSGRISNGVWTGYGSTSRDTGSAITLSGIETEVGDPIVRASHPTIISDMESLRLTGSSYDQENNTYFYNLFPQWIRDEDLTEGGGLVRELAHIGASYFDTIHHQIRFYKDAKNAEYLSSSAKPITFADTLVENMGLTVPNLFINPKIYEKVLNQDENELYDMTLFDVKNQIYHNIYNNIQSILKSKGTVDAMRNFLRSFGVNEEIVKLKMYTDKDTYFLNDNYKLETRPVKFANFSNTDNINASIIHKTPTGYSDINYVEFDESGKREKYSSFTAEANIMFPKTVQPGKVGHVGMNNTVSSLFGFHRPDVSSVSDYTWRDGGYDLSNLQVYAVKSDVHSRDVKFQLKDNGISPVVSLISPLFQEVYDNTTWNISIRMKPSGSIFYGYSNYTSIAPVSDPDFILEFYGTSYLNGEKQRSFYETQVLNTTQLKNLMHSDKRFYVGAHRENFTGSVLEQADTRVSAFRFWHSHLSNTELDSHARDITSYGVLSASQNTTLFEDQIETYFPKMDSLALNWNFELVTGSDSTGTFPVNDISSGSAGGLTQYGWHSASVGLKHGAQGFGFAASSSKVVDKDYVIVAKNPEPGNALLDDMINIRPEFREAQTDYNDVTDNFFSIEKSPYAVLTTEMLKLFSLSRDLNYLVGNPSNRYRMEYKELGDLRDIYFRNIENEPDVERFFDYYKWIDLSLNKMINQLIPFSTRYSENVSNIVESHLLERPKYRAIMPLLEEKSATEGAIQGFTALNYSWPTGHAPPALSNPSAIPGINDRNLSFLTIDKKTSPGQIALIGQPGYPLATSPGSTGTNVFAISFWINPSIIVSDVNTLPSIQLHRVTPYTSEYAYITFKKDSGTTNTDYKISFKIGDFSSNVGTPYSVYESSDISSTEWKHITLFTRSYTSLQEFRLYVDGVYDSGFLEDVTQQGPGGPSTLGNQLLELDRIQFYNADISISIDELNIIGNHAALTDSEMQEYATTLYNNGEYYNIIDGFNQSSGIMTPSNLRAAFRFGDESGDEYFAALSANQHIYDANGSGASLRVYGNTGLVNIQNGQTSGAPIFSFGELPPAPGSTTSSPNRNCFWQKARKEREGDNSIEREALRKVINDVDTLTTSSLYDLPTETGYDGATFVRNRRNKPYKLSINAVQNIHGGINYANPKDIFTFHSALQPHGELGASPTSVPQNVIGVGMDVIAGSGDGIISPIDCDDNILTKVNFSSNAILGKFYGDDYREKIKGHSILPMNLKNEVVQTGYNSKVNNFYRFDVVFTNLHTDIVDGTNTVPFQGPFTQTHVGGHQSRHVPINRFDDSMSSAKQLEVLSSTGGAQATGAIEFLLSDISTGDTITIEDSDGTSLTAVFSTYYDISTGRFTTADELVHIINTRLDATAELFDLNPVNIRLVQNAFGTDGNKTISTSNPAKITLTGFIGGASPGTASVFKKLDSRKTRPEAWGLLLKEHQYLNPDPDGAFGFVGADYGQSYPYVEALRATRFRDEHVKRPVNVRNIPHDTSSGIAGNYDRGLDVFQLSRDGQYRWYRDAVETAGTVLPATIESSLPNTTHYHTLISQRPVINGPVFSNLQVSQSGGPSTPIIKSVIGNNRYGDSSSQTGVGNIITTPQYAASNNSLGYEYTTPSSFEINTRFSAPGGPEIQTTSYLDAQSQTYSVYNALPYRNLTVLGRSSGEDGSKSGRVETIRSAIHVQSGTLPSQNFPYGGSSPLDRRGLRTLRQQRMGKSGTDHENSLSVVESADYPTIGSYHNTPANRSFTSQIVDLAPSFLLALGNACSIAGNSTEADCIAAGGTWGPVDFQAVLDTSTVDNLHDNEYVSRPIPSQDYGYSWIANLYAQLNGDMDETTSVARLAALSAVITSSLPAQRTTNFTPYEYNTFSRVSLLEYSAIFDAADQNAASLNTFFKQISEGYEALTNVLPEIDQYANANGTTEIYDPVLEKRIITSAHYFPTISDVSCCWPGEGNLNPVITITVPEQTSGGQPAEFTEDFDLQAIESGGLLFTDNTPRQIYEADLRKILLDVEVNACCTEPPQYIMHISGLTLPQPMDQGAEVTPVTTSPIPIPSLSATGWSTQKPDIFSQTDSSGNHQSHDIEVFQSSNFNLPTDFALDPSVLTVYVQVFVKDCEDRITELTITISNAHHS